MTRLIERLLNLRRGDLGRGTLLFSYLFLIMTSYLVARVARDALFLDKFQAVQLPYADMAIAALAGFVVAGYVSVGRRAGLRNLLVISLLVYAACCFLFWWLAHFYQIAWLYPVIYVWVGIFGVLAPAQVWTLANYVVTTREAKRLFGLVGSGAIAGAILGGKFANVAAPRFGTESLLLAMVIALIICAGLVVWIWRQRQERLVKVSETEDRIQEAPRNLGESLRLVWSVPYLKAIAALILIASIVTSIAGWQFKALAKYFIPETNELAAFFGDFYFYAGLAGLLVQLLVTSRVLRRFGMGPALFVVPMALLFGSVSVLVWGTLVAAIMLRGAINVFQYSIDKSTVELLYLPVPANVKVQVKSFIDTVIWRMGDGLSGVAILIFAKQLGMTAVQVSWVTLTAILGWLVAAFVARRKYVDTLRESIHQHRLDAEKAMAPVLDRATTEILVANLRAANPKQILYALSLLEVTHKVAAHPAVRDLLTHPSPEVRRRAISILAAAGDKTVLPQIEQLLNDPHLEVRTEALLYVTHHACIDPLARIQELGDFADFSIRSATVAFLSGPGEAQNLEAAQLILDAMVKETGPQSRRTRLEAARLLAMLPDRFDQQLRQLLEDQDVEVARHAVHAVGVLRKRRFVPRLLDRLAEPQLIPANTEALARFGDQIVGTLRDHLADPTLPTGVRRQIPGVLVQIGTQAAEHALAENLLEGDTTLRFRIISALNKIHKDHPELEVNRQMIETMLAAEILGHYRSYQILGTLGGNLDVDEPVVKALRESVNQEVERMFRLLGLLFPRYDLHSAYFGLQSDNRTVHDNALEFLDNILKPQLRNMLVPLLDSEVSVSERVRLANRLVGAKMETPEQAAAALVASEDPWLKSCGAYAIGTLGLTSLELELDKCLKHPDPLLRETAGQAKLRLAALSKAARPAGGGGNQD